MICDPSNLVPRIFHLRLPSLFPSYKKMKKGARKKEKEGALGRQKRATQKDPQNEVIRQPISKKTNLNLVPRVRFSFGQHQQHVFLVLIKRMDEIESASIPY